MNKRKKSEALAAIRDAPAGVLYALGDLLALLLADAYEEMESAESERAIWRAQGRARLAKDLALLLKKEG